MGSDDIPDVTGSGIKPKTNVGDLFRNARNAGTYVKICAPMVRYSKLEFRHLVRHYGADLCFTPMTMADSFCRSFKARRSEFATSTADTPLVAQFAAKTVHEYLSAAEMVYPYVDGIDLNCGCPQSWAIESGHGCAMLRDPQLIKDLTDTVRRRLPDPAFSVSVKIRLQLPLVQTVELCRQLQHCGVSFVTVHGRTTYQKIGEPSDEAALAEVFGAVGSGLALVANGDCRSLADADRLHRVTGCSGVMAARAILSNPALFAGHAQTPLECVQWWLDVCAASGEHITFQCMHHHLAFMMDKMMTRKVRVVFNDFTSKEQVLAFLEENYGLRPRPFDEAAGSPRMGEWLAPEFDETAFRERLQQVRRDEREEERKRKRELYSSEASDGKYFQSQAGTDEVVGSEEEEEEDDINCSDLFGA